MGEPETVAEVWVGVGLAARVLHVGPYTLRRYARSGRLPHMRTLGGHLLFAMSVLRSFHDRLAGEQETFEAAIVAARRAPKARDTTRQRDKNGHVRPPRAHGQQVPRLVWVREPSGTSLAEGAGWAARVEAVGPGYRAVLALDTGETLSWPPDPEADPKTLDLCKRWVRRAIDARHARARRAVASRR